MSLDSSSIGGLPSTDTTPSSAVTHLLNYKGFEINGKVAYKKVTINVNGEDKTFKFKVNFPASNNKKQEILDNFSDEKIKFFLNHSVGLGLGKKFSRIEMTMSKDLDIQKVKGESKRVDM